MHMRTRTKGDAYPRSSKLKRAEPSHSTLTHFHEKTIPWIFYMHAAACFARNQICVFGELVHGTWLQRSNESKRLKAQKLELSAVDKVKHGYGTIHYMVRNTV